MGLPTRRTRASSAGSSRLRPRPARSPAGFGWDPGPGAPHRRSAHSRRRRRGSRVRSPGGAAGPRARPSPRHPVVASPVALVHVVPLGGDLAGSPGPARVRPTARREAPGPRAMGEARSHPPTGARPLLQGRPRRVRRLAGPDEHPPRGCRGPRSGVPPARHPRRPGRGASWSASPGAAGGPSPRGPSPTWPWPWGSRRLPQGDWRCCGPFFRDRR